MIPLEVITTIGSMVIPPAFDFIKKKFIPSESDTPERTISSIATTKPETLPQVIEAYSKLYQAKKDWFNRDVIGETSLWVNNLRASIRPITVIICLVIYLTGILFQIDLPEEFTIPASSWIGLWFGDRMRK